MIHAWDHFDYTNDVDWWKMQGWPLVKVLQGVTFNEQSPSELYISLLPAFI